MILLNRLELCITDETFLVLVTGISEIGNVLAQVNLVFKLDKNTLKYKFTNLIF